MESLQWMNASGDQTQRRRGVAAHEDRDFQVAVHTHALVVKRVQHKADRVAGEGLASSAARSKV